MYTGTNKLSETCTLHGGATGLSARLAQRQRLRAQFLDWQAPLLSVPPAEMRSFEQAARWPIPGLASWVAAGGPSLHLSISSPRGCLRLQKVSDLSVPGNSAQKQLCCFSKKTECRKGQKKLDAASVTRTHDLQIGIRRIEVLLQSDDLPANLWPQLIVENGCVIFRYAGHHLVYGLALAPAPPRRQKCLSPARRGRSKRCLKNDKGF